jgi:Skp family chaperone for outer membrane proteins
MRFFTLLCCFLISSAAFAKDFKAATVDLQKLFKEYPGYDAAQKKFKDLAQKKQADLQESAQDLQELQNELKSSSSVFSAKGKRPKRFWIR